MKEDEFVDGDRYREQVVDGRLFEIREINV
jgi:hypothetical protein